MKKVNVLLFIYFLIFYTGNFKSSPAGFDEKFLECRANEIIMDIKFKEIKYKVDSILSDTYLSKTFIIDTMNKEHLIFMEKQRELYNIPQHIFYRQIWQESRFDNSQTSTVGAKGYLQIMPNTFNWIKENSDISINDINDPYDNIKAGAWYLNYQYNKILNRYTQIDEYTTWLFALSAYNAGYKHHKYAGTKFHETREYVKFILATI